MDENTQVVTKHNQAGFQKSGRVKKNINFFGVVEFQNQLLDPPPYEQAV